jgi:hypothetical protein
MATGDNLTTTPKANPVTRLALNPTGQHLVVEFTRMHTVIQHDNPTPSSRKRLGAVLGEAEPNIEGQWRVFRVGGHAH